jgi:hypothetical protein
LAAAAAGVVVPAAVASAAEEKIVDIDKAIRVLKRKIQQDGIFRKLKNRRFREMPSLQEETETNCSPETGIEDPAYEQTGRWITLRNPILGL